MSWPCPRGLRRRLRIGRGAGLPAAWLLAIALPWFSGRAFAAEEVLVRASQQADALRIVLAWPAPVQFQSTIKGRELVLQMDQALRAPQLESLPKRFPSWIEGIAAGYDSVLVLAARNVNFQVLGQGREITISLLPAPKSPAGSPEQAQGRLRMELQQVRLYASRGRLDQAYQLAMQLRKEHPEDLSVLSSLASVEKQIGRWRKADQLLSEGQKREPENGDLQSQRRGIHSEQSPRVSGDEERKTVPGRWSEQLTRLAGQAQVTRSLRVGATYDINLVQANEVQRLDGSLGQFDDFRQRGEFYVQNDFLSGLLVRGSVFQGLTGTGGGFAMAYPDCFGRTTVQADFQKPYWEYLEGLVDGGVRDRVELKRTLRAGSRWSGWGAVAANRYGLDADHDVARSVSADAGFNFLVTAGNPQVSLEYGFDKEHPLEIDSRQTSAGLSYFPIPLRDREVHSLSAIVGARLLPNLRTDGYGGFAHDRLGGDGPFMGLRLTYDRPSDFSAQVWFDHRLNTINTGETVNRLGGRLLWRF